MGSCSSALGEKHNAVRPEPENSGGNEVGSGRQILNTGQGNKVAPAPVGSINSNSNSGNSNSGNEIGNLNRNNINNSENSNNLGASVSNNVSVTQQEPPAGMEFRAAVAQELNLVTACKRGSIDDVKRLLQVRGTDVNMLGMWSSTPLIISLQYEFIDIAKLLITSPKIDVNRKNEKNATAMLFASMFGYADIVKSLAKKKAAIDLPPAEGIYNPKFDKNMSLTPFSVACINNNVDVVTLFLKLGAVNINAAFHFCAWKYKTPLSTKSGLNMSAISVACSAGSVEVVRELLKYDANIYIKDAEGMFPIHHIVRSQGDVAALALLDEFKLALKWSKDWLETPDNFGNTPLHIACENKLVEVSKLLIESGCSVNSKTFQTGQTPLHIAIKRRSLALVDELINNGADASIVDSKNTSSFDLIAKMKETDAIVLSVKKSANPKSVTNVENIRNEKIEIESEIRPAALISAADNSQVSNKAGHLVDSNTEIDPNIARLTENNNFQTPIVKHNANNSEFPESVQGRPYLHYYCCYC